MAGKLYTKPKVPGVGSILVRFGFILGLLIVTVLVLYSEEGLVDNRDGEHPGLLDCVYFAMVTITTVGYGDIVPVDTSARLVDAFLLTPVRLIFLFTFVGTAYQLVLKRLREDYRMKRVVERLKDHVIVCGYGATGRAAVRELLLQGTPPDQIVVLETDEGALAEAAATEVMAVEGDASRESVLKSVAIERAAHVIICSGRDDTAVLVALTARDLNPSAQLVATCKEQENARLLQRSGVPIIISAATAGGNLMAAATRQTHLVETMQDILTVGGALQLDERQVKPGEVGKTPAELEGMAVLRVYRDQQHFDVAHLPTLQAGDTIVFVVSGAAR